MPSRISQPDLNRRQFLGNSARNAAGAATGVLSLGAALSRAPASPGEMISVAVIGAGEQGRELACGLAKLNGVRLTAVCDVDARSLAVAQHELEDLTGVRPALLTEHEKLLERSDVDAVVIATPDHWHATIALDALQAEKDIYLEQPATHTLQAGKQLLQAARESGRIVQTGLPQRSGAHFRSAMELLQQGTLGQVHLAKAWGTPRRRTIGRAAPTAPPQGVDYARWLGSAPARPFQANRFHHHWPWFWDYGSGELGLWGVQLLDVVRWGLNLDLPTRIAAMGGQRSIHDDRETPDTLQVQFGFPDVDVIWEHRHWSRRGVEGRTAAAAFYGENGTLIIDRSGWKVYDGPEGLFADASEIRLSHLQNWIDSIRTRRAPSASLEVGIPSMAVCHLGNMAYRLGREIQFDPLTWQCPGDEDANRLLGSG